MPKGIAPNARPPKPKGAQAYDKPLWLKISRGKVFRWDGDVPRTPENKGEWRLSNRDIGIVREMIELQNIGGLR